MKRILLALLILFGLQTQAQTWIANDMNNVQYNLSDYTTPGLIKSTLVDISAHWCGPCWGWHNSGVMEELYHDFGPEGTNEFMVFFIDGDANSSVNLLYGGFGSQGNWVEGTPYPLIGPNGEGASVASLYNFPGYPTLFLHCGTGIAPEIQRNNKWAFWDDVLSCSDAFQYQSPDATLLFLESQKVCPEGSELDVELYNASSYSALYSATIELRDPNGTLVYTQQWSGDLDPFNRSTVTLNYLISTPGTWNATVILPNGVSDARPNGDSEDIEVNIGSNVGTEITVNIVTDSYGSETTWSICDADGNCYLEGGPYNDNTTIQTPVTGTIPEGVCVTFKIEDSYGDGMCCAYGEGSYTISDSDGWSVTGAPTTSVETQVFKATTNVSSIIELSNSEKIDNRMFDLLGREYKDYDVIPNNTLYIQNKTKRFKTTN